jgi:hypothetical protein
MNYSENDLTDLPVEDDPELREIEHLLRRLPVQEPSVMLDRRIEALARPTGRFDALRYVGLGAAAMLALVIGAAPMFRRQLPNLITVDTKPAPRQIEPARTKTPVPYKSPKLAGSLVLEHTSSRVTDEGVVAVVDGTPVQRYHKRSVQQVWMVDPKTGSPVSVTIPRDQVVLRKIEAY